MKSSTLPLFLFLFLSLSLSAQVTKMKDAGPDATRINFTLLGDGYTAGEQDKYATDADNIITDFFNEIPYSNYTNFFNVHRITVISEESGADHPVDDIGASHPVLDVNTALGGSFHWGGSVHRLLYCQNNLVQAEVAANYPASDQELVVINTAFYGGGGGALSVFSTHPSASDLCIHETGHSFANLGDEYDSGNNSERPNITSTTNAGDTRWDDWIGMNGVGEFGRNASTLKPVDGECMMEFLSRPFCSVCQEQTIESIYQLVSPLETTTPATSDVTATGQDLDFSITSIQPIPNTLTYTWELDGTEIATGVEAVTLTPGQITQPEHTLLVRVADTTELSMKNANYIFTYEWTIQNASLPLEWADFTARADGKIHRLDWTIARPENSSHFRIERAGEDGDWTELGELPFTGASVYRYYDEAPLAGDNLYRIRAVDFDGTLTDSPVRVVRAVRRHYFKVYPSVTDGPVKTEIFRERREAADISVIDAAGRLVLRETLPATSGWSNRVLDLSVLAAGSYTVSVVTGGEVYTQRVVRR